MGRVETVVPLPGTEGSNLASSSGLHSATRRGRDLRIDFVQLDSTDTDRSLAMAAELVDRGVDVIRAGGTEVVLKSAAGVTRTVPIVMVATDYDPLARGYVRSLARPGGNVTGVFMQQISLPKLRP
jgi:putative ABC transport system substrate-binding protein